MSRGARGERIAFKERAAHEILDELAPNAAGAHDENARVRHCAPPTALSSQSSLTRATQDAAARQDAAAEFGGTDKATARYLSARGPGSSPTAAGHRPIHCRALPWLRRET